MTAHDEDEVVELPDREVAEVEDYEPFDTDPVDDIESADEPEAPEAAAEPEEDVEPEAAAEPEEDVEPESAAEPEETTEAATGLNEDEVAEAEPAPAREDYRDRWAAIQSSFVDEPFRAVENADALVAEVWGTIAQAFAEERGRIEAQWHQDEEPATETLLAAFREYRTLFTRLTAV